VTRIVGLMLVRNEDNFVAWSISNAIGFCDELIVIDNRSTDATWSRLEALAASHPRIRLLRDARAERTNSYIQEYLGQDVWAFAVDGDEIYDPAGLARFRARIMSGEMNRYWRVEGHSVHATWLDLDAGRALGYVTPAAKPATKLYNLGAVASWHADTQRLHGSPALRPDWRGPEAQLNLALSESWDACDFRNLHMCFFPRSSVETNVEIRKNVTDNSLRNIWRRPVFTALLKLGLRGGRLGAYLERRAGIRKPSQYMRGGQEWRSVAGFGRPSDLPLPQGREAELEEMIRRISDRRGDDPLPS